MCRDQVVQRRELLRERVPDVTLWSAPLHVMRDREVAEFFVQGLWQALSKGARVVVHCAAARHRSPAACLLFFMSCCGMSKAAAERVVNQHSTSELRNFNQMGWLLRCVESLRAMDLRRMWEVQNEQRGRPAARSKHNKQRPDRAPAPPEGPPRRAAEAAEPTPGAVDAPEAMRRQAEGKRGRPASPAAAKARPRGRPAPPTSSSSSSGSESSPDNL